MAEKMADRLADFAQRMAARSLTDRCRIGVILIQLGMATCMAFFCISIAGMNIGMAIAGFGVLLAQAPIHRCVGFWWGVAFFSWQMLSRLVGPGDMHGLGLAYIWFCMPLAQIAFHHALPGATAVRRWAVRCLMAGALLSVLISVLQFTIGIDDSSPPWRISANGLHFTQTMGFFALHLTQGSVMGLVFFLAAGLQGWVGPVVSWGGRILAVGGVVLSGGRAALLGLCTGMVVQQSLHGLRSLRRGLLMAVGILMLGGLVIHVMTPYRLQNLLAGQDGRWAIWRTSTEVIARNPVFGAGGPRAYQAAYKDAYPSLPMTTPNEFPEGAPHAHNTVLAISAEHGLPAVLLFLILLLVPLAVIRRGEPAVRASAFGFVAMMLVFSQFENLSAQAGHVFWCGLGAWLAAVQHGPET